MNAHLENRCCLIALSHPRAPGPVHRLLFCKHQLVYVVGEHLPGSDLIEEEGSTFTELGAEDGDFTVALSFSSRFPSTLYNAAQTTKDL